MDIDITCVILYIYYCIISSVKIDISRNRAKLPHIPEKIKVACYTETSIGQASDIDVHDIELWRDALSLYFASPIIRDN